MTREEALAYLRCEAELMSRLEASRDRHLRRLRKHDVSEDVIGYTMMAYRAAMDDVSAFGASLCEKFDLWEKPNDSQRRNTATGQHADESAEKANVPNVRQDV